MSRTILMLEHDEDDRYITQATFDEHHLNVTINFVSTSNELIAHLHRCSTKKTPLPSLILLNYHASPLNATEILKTIKSDDNYKHIPVVVLSGTVNPDIIRACYFHGASSFIRKPSSNVEQTILSFARYWFETVQLV